MGRKINNTALDAAFIIDQAKNARGRQSAVGKSAEEPSRQEDIATPSEENIESATSQSAIREDSRKRKSRGQDYESLFIRDASSNTRNGKTVYIRKEFHDRIMRIVQVIGYNELTLFSYIDNVLEHHFSAYQEVISDLYDKRNTGIF